MKKLILLLFVLLFNTAWLSAQTILDDFSDGNYSSNPVWTVKAGSWQVSGGWLQNTATTARISTPFATACDLWEFDYSFETTSGAQVIRYFFLMTADNSDPGGSTADGYYVYIDGNNGDITLRRLDNGSATILLTYDGTPSSVSHTVKVTRNSSNVFELFVDGSSKGSVFDNTYASSSSAYQGAWIASPYATDNNGIDNIKYHTLVPPVEGYGVFDSIQVFGKIKDATQYTSVNEIKTHIGNTAIHRSINDAAVTTTNLWSAQKISTEINKVKIGDTVNTRFINAETGNYSDSLIVDGKLRTSLIETGIFSADTIKTIKLNATDVYSANIGTTDSTSFRLFTNATERVRITSTGNFGIGTNNFTKINGTDSLFFKLSVNGNIRAKKVIVETDWSDFVFEKGYKLMPIFELERYITKNKHLPDVPSAIEVKNNGVDIGSINATLLQKIEELSLYIIELKREIEKLNERIAKLESK